MKIKNVFFGVFFLIGMLSYAQETAKITIDSSPEIKKLIENKIAYNKTHQTQKGYRIQLFYGSESGAINTRANFTSLFPNTATYIDYEAPDWKVKVGNFKTRLEADKALEEIKLAFGNAFVLKEKIHL